MTLQTLTMPKLAAALVFGNRGTAMLLEAAYDDDAAGLAP